MSVTVTKTEQTVEVTQDGQTVTISPVTQTVDVAAAGPQGATGATGATGAAGSSGVVAVNAPLTNVGTSSSANLSVSAASTSASGVVQLSDSVSTTSSVLAATPTAVKSAYDLANAAYPKTAIDNFNFGTTSSVGILPLWACSAVAGNLSGVATYLRIVPTRDITVSNISMYSSSTASATVTLIRFGIYTRSGNTMTLVARTASDATIFTSTYTKYTRALDTTGGYPATYAMTAGSEYWIGYIIVATTIGTQLGSAMSTAQQTWVRTTSAQSDLPTSATGSVTTNAPRYAEVS